MREIPLTEAQALSTTILLAHLGVVLGTDDAELLSRLVDQMAELNIAVRTAQVARLEIAQDAFWYRNLYADYRA